MISGKVFFRASKNGYPTKGVSLAAVGTLEAPRGLYAGESMFSFKLGSQYDRQGMIIVPYERRAVPGNQLRGDGIVLDLDELLTSRIWRKPMEGLNGYGEIFLRRTAIEPLHPENETFLFGGLAFYESEKWYPEFELEHLHRFGDGASKEMEPTGIPIPKGHTTAGALRLPLWGNNETPVGLPGSLPIETLDALDAYYRRRYIDQADPETLARLARDAGIDGILARGQKDVAYTRALSVYFNKFDPPPLRQALTAQEMTVNSERMSEAIRLSKQAVVMNTPTPGG